MLLYFHSANHSNYVKEAIVQQVMVSAAATHCVAAQITWSHVVNIKGKPGGNVPVDLHNKHLNCVVKTAIANVGANVSTNSILQCGRSLKALVSILQNFDEQHHVPPPSTAHTHSLLVKDENLILEVLLQKSHVFDCTPGRTHHSFNDLAVNPAETIDMAKLCSVISKYRHELQRNANVANLFGHKFRYTCRCMHVHIQVHASCFI